MIHVSFDIPTMNCPACVMHLEGLEDELPGIDFIRANYRTHKLVVDFNEGLVSETQIRQRVSDLGYTIV